MPLNNYETVYRHLEANFPAEVLQDFFDTHERKVRDRVAVEVIRGGGQNVRHVIVPSSGTERDGALFEVESKLRERAEGSPDRKPPKDSTNGRTDFTAAADMVHDMRRDV